jgi:hypothetical protein
MPYLRQVLAGFGVVWGRSRLMRLAPGASVPEHADINYHWHTRVRLHVPVFTQPAGALPLRRAVGAHGRGRGLDLRQLAPAPRGEQGQRTSGSTSSRTPPARRRSGSSPAGRPPPREQWQHAWPGTPRRSSATAHRGRPALAGDAGRRGAVAGRRPAGRAGGGRSDTADAMRRAPRGSACCWRASCIDWRQLCALHGVGGRGRSGVPAPGRRGLHVAAKAARRRAGDADQRRQGAAGAREARFTAPRFRLDRLRSPSCERADP